MHVFLLLLSCNAYYLADLIAATSQCVMCHVAARTFGFIPVLVCHLTAFIGAQQ